MTHQSLNRPRSSITQCADSFSLNLFPVQRVSLTSFFIQAQNVLRKRGTMNVGKNKEKGHTSAQGAYRFPAYAPCLRRSGPSCSSSMSYLPYKECIVHMTRACRTISWRGVSENVKRRLHSCRKAGLTCENRAIALTISVLLSMTITAPVPNPLCASFSESKSMLKTHGVNKMPVND